MRIMICLLTCIISLNQLSFLNYLSENNQSLEVECHVYAPQIANGYTEEGIYYEIFSEPENEVSYLATDSKYVKRTVKYYSATVTVPTNIFWEEDMAGVLYSGNLKLSKYVRDYEKNVTTAYFEGYIYAE